MEIEDKWDIEYKVEPLLDKRYLKKVIIIIKNHSPYVRKFRISLDKIEIKDQFNNLRFRMYIGLSSPQVITIEKYKKEIFEIKIPRLEYEENDRFCILIENIDKKESKRIYIDLK